MQITQIVQVLEKYAPLAYQEAYDNAGLIVGQANWECTGILCTLDATEAVILEAKAAGCNLVVAHHPIIFSGLKKINGSNYVEQTIITAIKNDIAIYAIHTNLDNVLNGVNDQIANKLGLIHKKILVPKSGQLAKLFTFVPENFVEKIKTALFEAGAGAIGQYSECSFQVMGQGSFKGELGTDPFIGQAGESTTANEVKIEFIFPEYLKNKLVKALLATHPYQEVAYDIISLNNDYQLVGSGLIAELPEPMEEIQFLRMLQTSFQLSVIKHTALLGKKIQKIAICGGAGSFLIGAARLAGADIFVTSDIKYHEFFDANNQLVVADIGHWESEQFTPELLIDILQSKFPTFAVLKSVIKTNPVNYFL